MDSATAAMWLPNLEQLPPLPMEPCLMTTHPSEQRLGPLAALLSVSSLARRLLRQTIAPLGTSETSRANWMRGSHWPSANWRNLVCNASQLIEPSTWFSRHNNIRGKSRNSPPTRPANVFITRCLCHGDVQCTPVWFLQKRRHRLHHHVLLEKMVSKSILSTSENFSEDR